MAEDDPAMILVRRAKEEEVWGILPERIFGRGVKSPCDAEPWFLSSINVIVSLAHLYRIPCLLLIRDPWSLW